MNNFEILAPFVGGSVVIAFLLVEFLKKKIKESVQPRFGDLVVLLFLLVVSIVISLIGYVWGKLPADITTPVITIFSGAVVIYQCLIKAVLKKAILGKVDTDELEEK